jgi:hypothetical protein
MSGSKNEKRMRRNKKEMTMNQKMNRREFIRKAGVLLPVAAGLPLIGKSELNHGLPRYGTLTVRNGVEVTYFLDPGRDDPPYGRLRASLGSGISVKYTAIWADGSTIYLSSARPSFDGAKVPHNCREISITITSYTGSDDIVLGGTGRGRIRLSDGTTYDAEFSNDACFLTTACTAARGLPDDCMELQTLRAFRDSYVKTKALDGPGMIREYYRTAPAVVSVINARDDAAEIYDWMYRDLVVPSVRFIQHGQNARALDHYAEFFMGLQGASSF